MGFNFMGALNSLGFGDTPQDLRTPETVQTERNRLGQTAGFDQEYQRAQGDPNYGIGTPEQQRYQENELANSIKNHTSAGGAGGSGYEADAVRKGMVDFRISQIANRQKALNDLRQTMVQSNQGWQQPMGQPVAGIGRSMAGGFAGRAGQSMAKGVFGDDEDEQLQSMQRAQAAGAGTQPGGNGFRVNQSGPGAQSGGNGVKNPWSG